MHLTRPVPSYTTNGQNTLLANTEKNCKAEFPNFKTRNSHGN